LTIFWKFEMQKTADICGVSPKGALHPHSPLNIPLQVAGL